MIRFVNRTWDCEALVGLLQAWGGTGAAALFRTDLVNKRHLGVHLTVSWGSEYVQSSGK